MKVVRVADVERVQLPPGNVLGLAFSQQAVSDESVSKQFKAAIITFTPGARTKDHIHHTSDQVLYVLEGKGILASGKNQEVVGPGTIIVIRAGERHWHGATKDSSFTHISIVVPGKTTHYD